MAFKLNAGFSLVLCDPPWPYSNERDHKAELGGMPYDTLSIRDLCALRPAIDRVIAKDCTLLLWATLPKLPDAFQVMAAWGFKYTTVPFVWVKLNPTGTLWQPTKNHVVMNCLDDDGKLVEDGGTIGNKDVVLKGGVYSGLGSWVNGNAEIVLLGKRGRGCPRQSKSVKQIVFAPRGAHSAKPEEVRLRINQLFGSDVPGLELFARPPKVKNWLKLGLEVTNNDIREDLRRVADGC
jgi:N6-adenosine-specific RNA methylase IME4